MKTYMALDGLRWSRDSGSANCDMPRSAVFGRPGGGLFPHNLLLESDAVVGGDTHDVDACGEA